MCGIVGIAGPSAARQLDILRCMRERLTHRGPDSAGEYVDEGVALGIRRLRVIDLRKGDQPIANEDGTVWTVFNGEIYNFRELRLELARKGHRLRTDTDTEVIVHLYEEHGDEFVRRIDGMFALALWDARRSRLVLARDRLGKKPLLYTRSGGRLLFASEHSALLSGLSEREVDPLSILLYLRLGYVPAPYDAFAGIQKLPPATTLTWDGRAATTWMYWRPPAPGSARLSEAEAVQGLRELFGRAVRHRLIADVPVGAFLSGGLDSSAVVATMAREGGAVRTFSIGFDDARYSELDHAREIARRYATEHHEFIVRALDDDVILDLVRHYGEPYADSSAVPTYHLSRVTREHVTVALNGDGGDEMFAGYDRYRGMQLAVWLDSLPRVLRQTTALAAGRIPRRGTSRDVALRVRRLLRTSLLGRVERYLGLVGLFDTEQIRALAEPSLLARWPEALGRLALPAEGDDPAVWAQEFDRRYYLPDDLLAKVDIASMAASLEVRSPFLDTAVVEFAVSLPNDLKMRRGQRKRIAKLAFADRLPPSTLHRRKQGFGIPIGDWLRARPTRLLDTVASDRALARGYLRPEGVQQLVGEHLEGRADHGAGLWGLLMLELWHREYLDRGA